MRERSLAWYAEACNTALKKFKCRILDGIEVIFHNQALLNHVFRIYFATFWSYRKQKAYYPKIRVLMDNL